MSTRNMPPQNMDDFKVEKGTDLFACRNGEKSHYTLAAGSAMALLFLQYIVVAS
ncbi:MAG: hypothetical protein NTV89_01330 [Proteobacteria bacterium]|nr:hypothetical protein [Pseudomonadota bacterium]